MQCTPPAMSHHAMNPPHCWHGGGGATISASSSGSANRIVSPSGVVNSTGSACWSRPGSRPAPAWW